MHSEARISQFKDIIRRITHLKYKYSYSYCPVDVMGISKILIHFRTHWSLNLLISKKNSFKGFNINTMRVINWKLSFINLRPCYLFLKFWTHLCYKNLISFELSGI